MIPLTNTQANIIQMYERSITKFLEENNEYGQGRAREMTDSLYWYLQAVEKQSKFTLPVTPPSDIVAAAD